MTVRTHILFGLLLAVSSSSLPGVRAAEPDTGGRLRITLRTEIEASERLVRIADVAQIAGGNPSLRERVGQLDLVQLDPDESSVDVSGILVQARLLLSDAAPDGFRVDGAPVTRVVVPTTRSPEDRALAAAQAAIAQLLSLSPDEVVVRLSQPLLPDVVECIDLTPANELEARMATAAGGRTRVELWARDARGIQRVKPIAVEVRFRQFVPVATRPLKARQTLTADDVLLEPRELLRHGTALTLEQVTGKSLRRPLAAGDVLKDADVVAAVTDDDPVLIKPRDVIRVTARKGTLTLVMPTAEALQPGRQGEMIRVRNPRSGRVILGRVTSTGNVEVPL